MHRFLSIVISLVILGQSIGVQFGDLVQLDELIEHARFHQEEYGDNLLVFLSKHYGELKAEHAKKHQEERGEHEELPFQNHLQFASSFNFILYRPFRLLVSVPEGPFQQKTDNFYYQMPDSSLFPSGVFQPPRRS